MADESIFELGMSGAENIVKILSKTVGGIKSVGSEIKKVSKGGSLTEQLYGDSKEQTAAVKLQDELSKKFKLQQAALSGLKQQMQSTKDVHLFKVLQGEADDLNERLAETEAQLDRLKSGDTGGFGMGGGIQQPGMALSQFLRQLGGDQDSFTSRLGDMVDAGTNAADNLLQLKESFSNLLPLLEAGAGDVAKYAAKIPLIGSSLSGMIGGMSASVAGLLTIAVPVALAVGGVVLALKHMEDANRGVRESIAATIAAWDRMNENRRTLTTQELQERQAELQQQIAENQQFVDSFGNAVNQTFTEAQQQYGDALARLGFLVAGQSAGINDTSAAVQAHQEELNAWQQELNAINQQLESGEPTARDLEAAHESLTEALAREAELTKNHRDEVKQFNEELALQQRRENEDRRIADERSANSHKAELARIEEDGNNRIEDIRKESLKSIADEETSFAKAGIEAFESLTKALNDLAEETIKAENDLKENYMESETKSLKRHIKDMSKAENDYQKEKLRRLEDLNDELLAAEMANDVVRFIEAQQQGEKDLKRMAEDHGEQMTEQEQEWLEERQEAREQFQQELADLRENAVERRAELMEQYKEEKAQRLADHNERLLEIRTQAAERIAAEKTGIQTQLDEIQKRYEEERRLLLEDRQLQDTRQREDNERRLAQMQAQFDAEMKTILAEKQKQLTVIQQSETSARQVVIDSYTNMINKVKAIWAAAASSFGAYGGSGAKPPTYSNSGHSGGGGKPKVSIFSAEGGVFGPNRPTTVTMGEGRYAEAVVPLKHSRLPAGLGGAMVNVGDINISGADVTKSDVETALHEMALTISQAMMDARAGYTGRA